MKLKKIMYLLVCLSGGNREAYLRKHHIFAEMGEDVHFQTYKLPNETELIKLHNNVIVAADVTFYTHDGINLLFMRKDHREYYGHRSCIEIYDNVFIGGHSVIVNGVSIGPNAIVGGGSVVTHDVPPGTIVAGNPARVIGSFEDLHERRKIEYCGKNINVLDVPAEEWWARFYAKRKLREEQGGGK